MNPRIDYTPFYLAAGLGVLSILSLLGTVLYVRSKTSRSGDGLTVQAARWYCTVFPDKASEDVTERVRDLIAHDSLEITAHQDDGWGDICKRHGGDGHHKALDVTVVYQQHITVNYERTQLFSIVRQNFDRLARRDQLANPEPNWKQKANHFRTESEHLITELQSAKHENSELAAEITTLTNQIGELKTENDALNKQVHQPDPADLLKDIDDNIFHHIRNSYMPMSWPQKVALKLIWGRHSVNELDFTQELEGMGFADANAKIVKPIIQNKALIDWDGKTVWIKGSEVRRVMNKLFKETPLC